MLAERGIGRVHVAIDLRLLDRVGIERTGIGRHALESVRALRAARPHWRLTLESNRPDLFGAGAGTELRPTRWPTASSLGRASWLEVGHRRGAGATADLWLAPTFFLPRAQRGPSIVMVHDLVFAERPDLYRGRANAWYATRSARSAILRADRVLCATRALRARIVEWAGIDADRVRVIPWGGVDDAFRALSATAAPDEQAYWLFAGRWEARKGIEVLAAARAEAALRGTPRRLVLVGRPGRGAGEAVAALGRDSDVAIERDPGDERLAELYRGALALVYPSLIEGFGLPVAEAMAAGCPVISSDLAEVREWASDAPRYVPAGDPQSLAEAMREIAGDPERRRQMAERGLAAAKRLSWDRVGEAIAQAIEAVVAERASSA